MIIIIGHVMFGYLISWWALVYTYDWLHQRRWFLSNHGRDLWLLHDFYGYNSLKIAQLGTAATGCMHPLQCAISSLKPIAETISAIVPAISCVGSVRELDTDSGATFPVSSHLWSADGGYQRFPIDYLSASSPEVAPSSPSPTTDR